MKAFTISFIVFIVTINLNSQENKEIENLGFKVNSRYHELAPVISADGKILYFVRAGHPQNTMYKNNEEAQDIWYSQLDNNEKWGLARHEEGLINTRYSNSVCWVSPEGNRLLIIGGYDKKKFTGEGFSMCKKTADGWTPPVQLNIEGFKDLFKGEQYGATMSNDAKTLILFFSEKEGSKENDLYVSFLKEGNNWTRPVSIGTKINTSKYNEMTPFIAPDGVTLYFASNRKGGLGNMDIWKSTRLDDSWVNWSEPVNLGPPINTKGWDAFFTLDANSEYAFMVTTRASKGGADIVRIK